MKQVAIAHDSRAVSRSAEHGHVKGGETEDCRSADSMWQRWSPKDLPMRYCDTSFVTMARCSFTPRSEVLLRVV
jgi:hypothetical protein